MIGIYAIKNNDNGKIYIGQSKDLSHRKSTHLYDLKNNRHHNEAMQADYNKNPDAFVFEILCKCGADDLDDLEKYYIQKFKSTDAKYGYNLDGGGLKNFTCSESTRKKRSNIQKGNKNMRGIKLSEEWKRHISEANQKKKVICIETGIVYKSSTEAAKLTGLHRTKIVSVCTGNRKTTGGYHFKYYEQENIDR